MTELRGIQQRRGFRVAVIFALTCAAVAVVGKTVVAGDAPLFTGLQNEQQIRAVQPAAVSRDPQRRYRPLPARSAEQGHRAGSAATDLVHVARRRLGQGERAGEPVRSFAVKRDHGCAVGAVRPRAAAHRRRAELPGRGPDSGEGRHIAIDHGNHRPGHLPVPQRRRRLENHRGGAIGSPRGITSKASIGAAALDLCQPVHRLRGHLATSTTTGSSRPSASTGRWTSADTWSLVGGPASSNRPRRSTSSSTPAANILLVATNNGLFRSVNGGTNFGTRHLPSPTSPANIRRPVHHRPRSRYANSRRPSMRPSPGRGILHSTDGGATSTASNLFSATPTARRPPTRVPLVRADHQPGRPDHLRPSVDTRPAPPPGRSPRSNFTACTSRPTAGRTGPAWNRRRLGLRGRTGASAATTRRSASTPRTRTRSTSASRSSCTRPTAARPLQRTSAPTRSTGTITRSSSARRLTRARPRRPASGSERRRRRTPTTPAGTWDNLNGGRDQPLPRDRHRPRPRPTTYSLRRHAGHRNDRPPPGRQRPRVAPRDRRRRRTDGGRLVRPEARDRHDNGGYPQTTNGGNRWSGARRIPGRHQPSQRRVGPAARTARRPTGSSTSTEQPSSATGPPPPIQVNLFRSKDSGGSYSIMKQFASSTRCDARVTAIATSRLDSSLVWVGFRRHHRGQHELSRDVAHVDPDDVTGSPGAAIADRNRSAEYPGRGRDLPRLYSCHPDRGPNETRLPHRRHRRHLDGHQRPPAGRGQLPRPAAHSVVIDPGPRRTRSSCRTTPACSARSTTGRRGSASGRAADRDSTSSRSTTVPPALLRIGTYGRSSFELKTPTGPVLAVNSDLGFGYVSVGQRATRLCRCSTSARPTSTLGDRQLPATPPSRSSRCRRPRSRSRRAQTSTTRSVLADEREPDGDLPRQQRRPDPAGSPDSGQRHRRHRQDRRQRLTRLRHRRARHHGDA